MMNALNRWTTALFAVVVLQSSVSATEQTVQSKAGALKVEVLTNQLEHPWGLAFLPDGQLLVTERPGRLRYLSKDGKLSAPIQGLPDIVVNGQGGLLDVLLDKDFASNQRIYVSFAEPGNDGNSTAIASATLRGQQLSDVKVIFSQQPKVDSKYHFGGRLVQDLQGNLFVTLGDRLVLRKEVQQLDTSIGKVVHITPDGKPAANNPYLTTASADARVWSYGHRNIQGATLDAQGRLWTHEHGPQGGDEINITQAGKNYGWPLITYGEEYGGGFIGPTAQAGLEQPLHYWVPSIAPSGMMFYNGDKFASWRGDLFVGSLKFGLLVRLDIENDKVVSEERLAIGKRVRDVKTGPDGFIYLLTDEDDGAILRVSPAKP